jgi:hypothetical protein
VTRGALIPALGLLTRIAKTVNRIHLRGPFVSASLNGVVLKTVVSSVGPVRRLVIGAWLVSRSIARNVARMLRGYAMAETLGYASVRRTGLVLPVTSSIKASAI